MRLSFLLFWFSLSSDLFYFSFLSSNFWSISRREAGCWWDLICSRFSFLSFALARLHNMLPMMNTFAALNLFYCLFFASFFDSRECFSFLNVFSQILYFVFHFNIKIFLFFFPLLFLFLVLVPICSFEFSRFEPLLPLWVPVPGKQGQALLASIRT